jgi:hypothetical protein
MCQGKRGSGHTVARRPSVYLKRGQGQEIVSPSAVRVGLDVLHPTVVSDVNPGRFAPILIGAVYGRGPILFDELDHASSAGLAGRVGLVVDPPQRRDVLMGGSTGLHVPGGSFNWHCNGLLRLGR